MPIPFLYITKEPDASNPFKHTPKKCAAIPLLIAKNQSLSDIIHSIV